MTTHFAPRDWPGPGPIDLDLHDLPHASSSTEWWYVNAHLRAASGREVSLFCAFFRVRLEPDPVTKEARHSHFVTWALSDAQAGAYYPTCEVDDTVPRTALARLKAGRGTRDHRVNRAMQEVLEKGHVPLPDRQFRGGVSVSRRRLALDYAGSRFEKTDDGRYALSLYSEVHRAGVDLVFSPRKPPIRHGDDGVVRGVTGEDMFYYFIPRCEVRGSVTLDAVAEPVAEGEGWYDHEFGGHFREASLSDEERAAKAESDAQRKPPSVAWNWAAVQLDDGTDVSAYALYDADDERRIAQWTIVSAPDGARSAATEMTLEPEGAWRSTRTFHTYPTGWRLRAPGLDLALEAAFPDQEIITVVSKPAFWEGRVIARGTAFGREVRGLGYVERSGFEPIRDLDGFFGAVSEEVRRSVETLYPLAPTLEEVRGLIASEDRPHYMDGVDPGQIGRTLIKPVRDIVDRGGKGWRSYAVLACCDVVLGDSRRYVKWLALPELMHVGSLIVDDVQDASTVRRGGPTTHVVYGDAVAINAGTAAYFMTQRLLAAVRLPSATRLRLYDLYFEAMRAGHAGQAMDLDGVSDLMDAVVETGDARALTARVLGTHRLKTAAPAGALARMGALAGEGSAEQVEAVGRFFESLGLAFQIMDDVLNLRGFRGNLKARAEDVTHGKVTLPVVMALGRLGAAERRWLWETLAAKPTDPEVVSAVVAKLEEAGAIDACEAMARDLIERAWREADPVLPDSLYKIMLRAFGWYILERHY